MATLVFTAIGTAIGGPLGGALGSLLGNQVDRAVFGGPKREGPRLKELGVSTSSYGTPIPRHHGTIRAPGSIIWATDVVERKETSGGSKGSPSTTSYSYTVSFAVALSSRPICRTGRIWADGNLLRGAAGDLKAGGSLRIHMGHADQDPDPLIASAMPDAPAFRGTAYCVFEDLALGDFGNRIPALTFEIVADEQLVSLAALVEPIGDTVALARPLDGLTGYSNEGGALGDMVATLAQLYPVACDAGGDSLSIVAADTLPALPRTLPPPAAAAEDSDSFAAATGALRQRLGDAASVPDGVRYYDPARDYQPGMQRAEGRARPGRSRTIEMPGVLSAHDARALANGAAARAASSRDTLAWRMAELDPGIAPGEVVSVPGRSGSWSIEGWEWRDQGVELELRRLPRRAARQPSADPGASLPAPDARATPTLLTAFEAPWDGTGNSDERRLYAALSSASSGWRGAALYLSQAGELVPLGYGSRRRSIMGATMSALGPSPSLVFERDAEVVVTLASGDFTLDNVSPESLAGGANRALVGGEVLQFAAAERLSGNDWRLEGLVRGRGGTEANAAQGHPPGSDFVLLDDAPVAVDTTTIMLPPEATMAALGLADTDFVVADAHNSGLSRRPLAPVHGAIVIDPAGGRTLSWRRRARGQWLWADALEVPLVEQSELYRVGIGAPDTPALVWDVSQPRLALSEAQWAELAASHAGKPLWVRQVGTHALSLPLLLATFD